MSKSNLKEIMMIQEKDLDLVVFSKTSQEAGINTVYDPQKDSEIFQVFVHQNFPYREVQSWEFDSFREARNFAASQFKDWEMYHWNHGVNRPCGKDGSCGSGGGGCSTKKNADGTSAGGCGGGCSTCGATKEFDELLSENSNQ